jgi:hypothetical protein
MQTVINRRLWAWSSCEWLMLRTGPDGKPAADEIIVPVIAVSYNDGAGVSAVMAAGDAVYGVADGQYEIGGMSITLLSQFAREWMKRATADGSIPLSQVDFHLTAKKRAAGSQTVIRDDVDFRVTKATDDHKVGPDALATVFECLPTLILRDGVRI